MQWRKSVMWIHMMKVSYTYSAHCKQSTNYLLFEVHVATHSRYCTRTPAQVCIYTLYIIITQYLPAEIFITVGSFGAV